MFEKASLYLFTAHPGTQATPTLRQNTIVYYISLLYVKDQYESIATVGEIRVWWRADFQSGSRVLKKVI